MKTFQTWMVSAVFLLSVLGLTACGTNNNRNATTTENSADKTNSSYYVNGATDTTNRGNDGVLDNAVDDIGDVGRGVINGVGDAGRAVIDGAENLGDTLTRDRGNLNEDDDLDLDGSDDEIINEDDRDNMVDRP